MKGPWDFLKNCKLLGKISYDYTAYLQKTLIFFNLCVYLYFDAVDEKGCAIQREVLGSSQQNKADCEFEECNESLPKPLFQVKTFPHSIHSSPGSFSKCSQRTLHSKQVISLNSSIVLYYLLYIFIPTCDFVKTMKTKISQKKLLKKICKKRLIPISKN